MKRASVGLRQNGLRDQECVGFISPNDIYISVLGDAIIAAGGIFTGFPADSKESEMATSCQAAQVSLLLATPESLDLTLKVARQIGIPDSRVWIFDPPGIRSEMRAIDPSRLRFTQLLEDSDEADFVNVNASKDPSTQIMSRLFTSGTTGSPKAAEVSHAAEVKRGEHNFMLYHKEMVKYLHFIGMHHMSGTVNRAKAVIGMHQMHITRAQEPQQLVDLVQKWQIESMMTPPRTAIAITSLIQKGTCTKDQIKSVRHAAVGGSQVPNEAMDNLKGCLPEECLAQISYGSTELGFFSRAPWTSEQPLDRPGYVGLVCPYQEVKIINPETKEDCGFEVDGEICGSSLELFSGYCNNQKATDESFFVDDAGKRWFRSGDRGRLSANRHLSVTGRFKEIFKVDTEEVAPAEVELVLSKHPGVKDVAIAPTADRNDSRYYEVKAYVVPNEEKKPVAQEIVDFVATILSPHKAPTGGVTMVSEIPRNPMKKIITRKLGALEALPGSEGYMEVLKN